MGLFTQLEKFDQKLTRGYARWGRWVWRTLIVVPVLVVLWNIGQAVWGGPRGGVILEIHSEIDRPILGFSVNGVAGANAFANGGGSTTCCGDVSGDTAEVIWTLSTTRTQYNAGMRLEKRKRTARAVLTGMCYSAGSAMRHGSSSLTRLTGQSAMTPSTWRR